MTAQVIGKNTSTGTITSVAATSPKLLYGTGQQAVLNSNQKLVSCNVYWGNDGGFPTGNPVFTVALYDTTNGTDFTTAARIDATIASFNFSNVGRTAGWVSVAMNVDMAVHAGKTLAVGIGSPLSGQGFGIPIAVLTGASRKNAATQGNSAPATLATSTVSANQAWGVYFQTADINVFALDSVTPNPVTNTGTLTAVISGNATAGTVDFVADGLTVAQTVTSWTYNGGTDKTTVVTSVVQGGIPFGPVTVNYILGGGLGTLTTSVTVNPVSGNAYVNIASPSNAPGYIFEQLATGTYTDVTQVEYSNSPNTVVAANGLITQTAVNSFTARARDGSDKTWSTFSTINTYVPAAYAIVGSGGASSGGAAGIAKLRNAIANGGAISGGVAGVSKAKNVIGSGAINSGGSAAFSKRSNVVGGGGAISGGAAITGQLATVTYNVIGSGGVVSGGAAVTGQTAATTYNVIGSGGAIAGGQVSVQVLRDVIGDGGTIAGGVAVTLFTSAVTPVVREPYRLVILKRLCAHLEEITVANGFDFDLDDSVFRGRMEFGAETPVPMLSIVESTKPDSGEYVGNVDKERKVAWPLFVQGWVKNDQKNPSDPAYWLMAAVEHQLGKLIALNNKGDPLYPEIYLLGAGDGIKARKNLIVGLEYGPGVVSPPRDQVSSQAFFFLPIWITFVEKLGQPYFGGVNYPFYQL